MGDDRVVIRSGNCDKMAEDDEDEEEKIMGEERKEGHSCIEQMVLEVPPQEPEAINRSRNVREKVQTWMTGIVTEVKRKSPSMVHRWVSSTGEQQRAAATAEAEKDRSVDLERIDEVVDFDKPQTTTECTATATDLRSTIKSKLHLNALYDKISKTRDITTGLFRSTTMDQQQQQRLSEQPKGCSEKLNSERALNSNGLQDEEESEDEHDTQKEEREEEEELDLEPEDDEDDEIELPKSEIEGEHHKCIGHASSPKHSQDEEFQFSFEDFSFIETNKANAGDSNVTIRESQKDSGIEKSPADNKAEQEIPSGKPRRLNIGEIGRSASAKQHPDSNADLGIGMGTKRHLLSDIGRRFSEMNESALDCEFRGDWSVPGRNSHSHFRPNSMPVSPKPRMLLSAQHRESVDFAGNKKRNSLFREYSTQSDSSRCSSVESLLESRKPDAESILINLGFGPIQSDDVLSRLPKRFLKPSQVNGIDTEDFLKQQQLATTLHEQSVLGYRGLVGNSHYPSHIVAKIMERFQVNEYNRYLLSAERPASAPPSPSTHITPLDGET